MKKISIDTVISWGPCYTRDKILKISDGREHMTALEICDLNWVSTGDKLWLLLRPEIIPDTQLHILACHWAEQALLHERKAGREPDERSFRAIEVKRKWIDGLASVEELAAASDAARDAARAAASDAARDAARDAELQGVRAMLVWLEEHNV